MGAEITERRPLRLENAVRRHRLARGWTLDELAARSGISRRSIVNIEGREEHEPEARVMLRLAEAFEVEMGDLFWSAA